MQQIPSTRPPSHGPPPFSSLPMKAENTAMDIEYGDERRDRAASVLSGMSQEDMEAAETLKSLQSHFQSPRQQTPPRIISTRTTFTPNDQQEPLFSLLTSQYPMTASMINRSLSIYKGTQSYIPGAYTVEQNVGLPLANMLGRVTGVEGGIRWALQPKRRGSPNGSSKSPKADVESGVRCPRRTSAVSEDLPAYDDAERSPPYQREHLSHGRDGQTPPGWRAQLMISTSGLGIAMSEESLRSLRYCLTSLKWANERLGAVILHLHDLLKKWDESQRLQLAPTMPEPVVAGPGIPKVDPASHAALVERIQALKGVVLQTIKQVVDVLSNYAGGALPENARNLVHRHITSLPARFRLASSSMDSDSEKNGTESAHRVMMLAQEGLSVMGQVTSVVNDTLVSAESWCEKLGRRPGQQGLEGDRKGASMVAGQDEEKMLDEKQATRESTGTVQGDVKMRDY